MIRRTDYTERDWDELLARCKLLTEEHEWEIGDALLSYQSLSLMIEPDSNWIPIMRYEEKLIEKMIWLPRLDQLVRMFRLPNLSLTNLDEKWIVEDEYANTLSRAPTPELATLRSLQRCEEECGRVYTIEGGNLSRTSTLCIGQCAGIHEAAAYHQINIPHHCLSHALERIGVPA